MGARTAAWTIKSAGYGASKDNPFLLELGRGAQVAALEGDGGGRILVGGLGNVLRGDDAFGIETIRRSRRRSWPAGVRLVEFGIHRHELAFALTDGYDAAILVDAAPRGQPPGTLYLVEIEQDQLALAPPAKRNPQGLDPVVAIRMANAIGQSAERIYLVSCEPVARERRRSAHLRGGCGLSAMVEAAVEPAVDLIEAVVARLLEPCAGS